ncbi:VOC family protein [Alteromonas lipolytica]|uniref:Glyoxalase/fosfomycin resistance/dioxygenase domain-containing protein n=1 Tax=Alteromonas lipolytica TaxID=1856405 RepID=A0A1E8FBP1_9ALTE|nr:VOC family protein [Alteromonas lipolytica]OFI33344.1 hypothetical protein BFC17_03525 [Alteromonas lipolytica]GGF60547.1 hypothetical protein GCM10011338_10970 [Alteromonas lipolytica]
MKQPDTAAQLEDLYIKEIVIATADYAAATAFWCEQLGYQQVNQQTTTDPALLKLWQVSAERIGRRALLGLANAHTSIHLVEVIQPASPLKQHASNLDAIPKTLNLLVKDLPNLWLRLKEAGVTMKTDWVEYEQDGRRYRDAHITGPDYTGIGLLEVLDEEYPVNHLGIGEPASFTCTIEDIATEANFYTQLGGQKVLDEHFWGQAIEKLVGLPPGGSLHMQLFGPRTTHSRIELVSYGIPMTSHYERARFPHTGALFTHIASGALTPTLPTDGDTELTAVKVWNTPVQMARLQSPAGATVLVCKE